jgi:2-haloacid dehalogenase
MTVRNGVPAMDHLACVFDAYGTLFDVHSAVGRHAAALGASADAFSRLWRAKQLEYSWLRSLMLAHADFWEVTRDALEFAAEAFGLSDEAIKRSMLESYLTLDAYDDVRATLAALQQRGIRCAILSNGSPEMLEAAVRSAALSGLFECVLSVEDAGIYQPAPAVYRLAAERLGLEAEDVWFVSSNAWDAAGAARFGFRVAWINRFKQQPERLPFGPHVEVQSLADLPELLTSPA